MSEAIVPKRGDRYISDTDPTQPLFIAVTRVSKNRTWADIKVRTWRTSWTKRQPLPIPGRRANWTEQDIVRSQAL